LIDWESITLAKSNGKHAAWGKGDFADTPTAWLISGPVFDLPCGSSIEFESQIANIWNALSGASLANTIQIKRA